MTAWTLTFPWKSPPLTENQRFRHWAIKAALVKKVRAAALSGAAEQGIPFLGRCRVTLTWVVATTHRRDADNVNPTLKALCDGLVDANLVLDDVPAQMEKIMPIIRYEKGSVPHMELLVEQLA